MLCVIYLFYFLTLLACLFNLNSNTSTSIHLSSMFSGRACFIFYYTSPPLDGALSVRDVSNRHQDSIPIQIHYISYSPKSLDQWFSNFLHQVPPQKIFGFPSTTIMTNIKMQ